MESKYDLSNIENMHFESEAIPVLGVQRGHSFYRLSPAEVSAMPDEANNHVTLRRKMSAYFMTKIVNYAKLEELCLLKRNTYQKVMNFSDTRKITYDILARFCIGAKLTEEEARELFLLQGHELSPAIKSDYILLHYLHSAEGILDYSHDMIEYCGVPEKNFDL